MKPYGVLLVILTLAVACNAADISGDSVTFAVVSQMFGMEMKTLYKEKITGSEIKFTAEQADGCGGFGPPAGPQEMVEKKLSL